MDRPLEIAFANTQPSPAIEKAVRDRVHKLERHFRHIVGVRVVFEAKQKSHRKGNLFQFKIFVTVPNGEIVVDRANPRDHSHEEWQVALRDAFEAAERQLEDHSQKIRGEVKAHRA